MAALLDVNVLVALFDPDHINHDAAHAWFSEQRSAGWATCPITENGLVRVVSSPSYPGRKTTAADASLLLSQFCENPDHQFWNDTISLRDPSRFRLRHVQGHRQLTDSYLLALAVENGGSLATFDSGVRLDSAVGATGANLAVI